MLFVIVPEGMRKKWASLKKRSLSLLIIQLLAISILYLPPERLQSPLNILLCEARGGWVALFGPKSRIFQDRPLVSSRQRYTEQHGAYLLPIPMSFSHHYGMPAWEDSVFEYDFHVISQSDSSLRPLLVPSEHFSEGSQYLLFTFPRWPTVCISLLCVGAVARFTWPFSLSPAVPFSSLMALLVPTWCLPDLFFSWSLQLGEAESVHLSLLSRQVVLGSYPLVTAQDLRFQC